MFGKFFIVATPIGNLKDITERAKETLGSIDVLLAEDTRVTQKLLMKLFEGKWSGKLISYHQHSNDEKKLEILKFLIDGKNVALVTDAGTPGISDPGNELVDFVLESEPKIKIIPIPGPSSLTTALSVCGFNVSKFEFLGFFPKKKRTKTILKIQKGKKVYMYFDSPNRLLKNLTEIQEHTEPKRRVFVARELTKMYEETQRGKIKDVVEKLKNMDKRGEVVVIIEKKI